MNDSERNGLQEIIDKAIEEMARETGDSFDIEHMTQAVLFAFGLKIVTDSTNRRSAASWPAKNSGLAGESARHIPHYVWFLQRFWSPDAQTGAWEPPVR